MRYAVGDFSLDSYAFTPGHWGLLDVSDQFYATNLLYDAQGRCILFAWVRGFAEGRGWNGCLALPRVLTLGPDDRPRQQPVPELQALRRTERSFAADAVARTGWTLDVAHDGMLEMKIALTVGSASEISLHLGTHAGEDVGITAYPGAGTLDVAGLQVPCAVRAGRIHLHLFLDKSVLELFVHDGEATATKVFPEGVQVRDLRLAARGGTIAAALTVWALASSWA